MVHRSDSASDDLTMTLLAWYRPAAPGYAVDISTKGDFQRSSSGPVPHLSIPTNSADAHNSRPRSISGARVKCAFTPLSPPSPDPENLTDS